ncbi:MAG: butyrate kinase [Defluviitaleaceae bacterium]|nr:butyrate kinase [Defluviitaleaceae bacterium]
MSVYENEQSILDKDLTHDIAELGKYEKITDQYEFRKGVILDAMKEAGIELTELDAVVGRGGLVKPLTGGTYAVNEVLMRDLRIGVQGEHASNVAGLIAHEIATMIGKPAFIVDPVVVDELDPISRISGHPWIERRSIFHALNQKAIARQYGKEVGKKYDEITVVVAHMGGGISVGIHNKGRVVDVSNALNGEGPFSPERSGTLPVGDLAAICFSGTKTLPEVKKAITGQGGIVAYLGSNDVKAMVERAETDEKAKLIIDAMIYQIAKEIAAVSTAVNGKVDAILLTGGLAFGKYITEGIENRVKFITDDVRVYPGGHEHLALAQGALRVLNGEEQAKIYG